jgi:leucyl aminopeptidase (aminopeptidase T)
VARVAAEVTETEKVRHETIAGAAMHGTEPPGEVAAQFAQADVVFCLTRASMAHTHARRVATDRGTRFLSLPDYSLALLADESLLADFAGLRPQAEALAARLDRGATVTIRSAPDAELGFTIAGRRANCCPGICAGPGALASPPDAEVNVAPAEDSAEGLIWIDGSVPCPEIGLLAEPLGMVLREGRIAELRGPAETVARLETIFDRLPTSKTRVLAEFGIGLNPRAHLSGRMLEDEGCAGTIHLGFGSNATIGGRNEVAFHLDFVLRRPTVWIDRTPLLTAGAWPPAAEGA